MLIYGMIKEADEEIPVVVNSANVISYSKEGNAIFLHTINSDADVAFEFENEKASENVFYRLINDVADRKSLMYLNDYI